MGRKVPQRVPVSWRAVVQRINRLLRPEGARLKSGVRGRVSSRLGPYYVVVDEKTVLYQYKTREQVVLFARRRGALADYETVEEER
jgi:hypothetical protein